MTAKKKASKKKTTKKKTAAKRSVKKPAAKNAFYAQSGGVTAVINASACGVIEEARKHKGKIGKIYAGRNGIIGALTEDLTVFLWESFAAISIFVLKEIKPPLIFTQWSSNQ